MDNKFGLIQTEHGAKILVSVDLLAEALALPEGISIVGARFNISQRAVELYLLGGNIPKPDNDEPWPSIKAYYTADYTKKPSTWLTFSWEAPDE